MDRFFSEAQKNHIILQKDILYLLGITCIFIASKFSDVNPVSLKLIFKSLGHEKFT